MKIKWLGTASLMLESANGKDSILFDPYLRPFAKNLPAYPVDEIGGVKGIFITHPHFDHFISLPEILKHTDCPVYVNHRGTEIAAGQGYDLSRLKEISAGDCVNTGAFQITAYQGSHIRFDRFKFITTIARCYLTHPRQLKILLGQNDTYAIDLEKDIFVYHVQADGKSVLIIGSAGMDSSVAYPPCDMLVFPYQGRSDICRYSERIISQIKAPAVFFDHIDNAFPPVSSAMDTRKISRRLKDRTCITPIEGQWYEI